MICTLLTLNYRKDTMTTQSTVNVSTQTTKDIHHSSIKILFQHNTYYLPEGDLFIKIDNILFCVHTYFFTRESIIWRNILETTHRGWSINDLIEIGIHIPYSTTATVKLFAHFLWVFYNPTYYKYTTTREIWDQIYNYALLLNWEFDKIQELCWQGITRIDREETDSLYDWMYNTSDINPDDKEYWTQVQI